MTFHFPSLFIDNRFAVFVFWFLTNYIFVLIVKTAKTSRSFVINSASFASSFYILGYLFLTWKNSRFVLSFYLSFSILFYNWNNFPSMKTKKEDEQKVICFWKMETATYKWVIVTTEWMSLGEYYYSNVCSLRLLDCLRKKLSATFVRCYQEF